MAQHHSARYFTLGGVRTAAKPGLCPGRRIADHTAHPYVYSMVLLRISRQGCYGRGLSLMDDAEHKKPVPWRRRIAWLVGIWRSEEHTSELQSLMRISYAVFCLKKKNNT